MLQSIMQCPIEIAAITEVIIKLQCISLWCCTRILPIPQLKYSAIYCFRVSLVQHKNIAQLGIIVKQCPVDIAITEVTIMLQSISLWCCTRILPIPQLKYSAIYCFRVSLVQHKNIAQLGIIVNNAQLI